VCDLLEASILEMEQSASAHTVASVSMSSANESYFSTQITFAELSERISLNEFLENRGIDTLASLVIKFHLDVAFISEDA